MPKKQGQPFEEAMKRLEDIVARMEGGGLTLEESTTLYEEGVKLSAWCREKLDITRRKVMQLVEDNTSRKEVEFDDADE